VALVSCGRRNRFGHPDPGALGRLGAAGLTVHRTDREGAVWLELSSTDVRVIDWRHGAPRASPRFATPAYAPAL
jgi:beta-lactamase superfamily II metal-dependent hydrolase